ncbi:13968_t:CDS:2, partial [Racocetra persica]
MVSDDQFLNSNPDDKQILAKLQDISEEIKVLDKNDYGARKLDLTDSLVIFFTTIALLLIVSAIIISQDKPAIIFTPTTIEIIKYPRNKNETISTQE